MATLPTNFKDDILDTSVNTRRRYRVYENTDGTIELEDVTEYSQVGDVFGAGQINSTNTEVNKKFDKNMLVRDLDTINAITKEGYAPDALALKEVNDSLECLIKTEIFEGTSVAIASGFASSAITSKINITIPEGYTIGSITPITRDGAINASVFAYNETTGVITLGYINRYTSSVTIKPQVLILFVKS